MAIICLANEAMPCGYAERTFRVPGHGPPSLRKKTDGRLVFIKFNRKYWRGPNLGQAAIGWVWDKVTRRGHYRHLWKLSGVDPPSGSLSPLDRHDYAQEKGIAVIWVPEHEMRVRLRKTA